LSSGDGKRYLETIMRNIIYLVGLVVVVLFILSLLGIT